MSVLILFFFSSPRRFGFLSTTDFKFKFKAIQTNATREKRDGIEKIADNSMIN